MRAGEQLHITPQTLSAQIKLLEARLGKSLFRKAGRNLELTEAGLQALRYADEIFALGAELESTLRDSGGPHAQAQELRIGLEDVVAKSVAYRLLEPALTLAQPVRLICTEGRFPDLLAQLALHRLDLVISDKPLTNRLSVRAFNHKLGSSTMSFFCAPELASRLGGSFPRCLDGAPMLMPGASSSVRPQFDAWLTRQRLRPRVVGEFDDGALMKAFGREGNGVFLSPTVLEDEIVERYNVRVLGRSDELIEDFYAISVERRIKHPGVAAITQAARNDLFGLEPLRTEEPTQPTGS